MLGYQLLQVVAALRLPGRGRHVKDLFRLRLLVGWRHPLRVGSRVLGDPQQSLAWILGSLVVSIDVLHDILGVCAAR